MPAERTVYNGYPILILKRHANDKYPFKLGLSKLRLIVENIAAVQSFVADHVGQTFAPPASNGNAPVASRAAADPAPAVPTPVASVESASVPEAEDSFETI